MKDYSVSTSNVPPRAAQLKPHLQTFFPSSAPPNFSPHFADPTASPYSSGSSSSFPNESPPAEPPFDMEPDFTPIVSSPDDLRYSHPAFDQGDPADWTAKGLSALSAIPYNTEAFAQQPLATPMSAPHMSWPSDPEKFHYQHLQQQPQQTQHVNHPSFSAPVGRGRSLSDGTPSGTGSNTNRMNSLYTQHVYSGQNVEDPDLVYPQDPDARSMDNGPNIHNNSSFPPMHSYPQEQQQRSPHPPRVKRELGRSMSDAAAPQMRPSMYTSASQPSAYGSFGLTMHTTSTHTTTVHSSSQGSQSHAVYAPQHRGGIRHNAPISMPMPMPVQTYGSIPTYSFNEQTSDPHAGYSSGGHLNQNVQAAEELSPMMRFRQMDAQGQGGCDPRYVNGDMSGEAARDADTQDVYKTNGTGAVKKEEEEKYISSDQADEGVHSEHLDAEGDEDADGDDERDGDYQTGDDEDFDDDGDGEYVVRSRRTTMSPNTHSLRPRRHSSTTRYQPYSVSANGSTSRSASKPVQNSPSQPTRSRSGTRVRSRHTVSLPVPVPVPNLTKKSRGRRVPTVDFLTITAGKSLKDSSRKDGDEEEGKNARTYTCDAVGCGKCFARGEHLKRHVRSIHTYEKPHRCPFPGCGKDFSRHDNLRQHLRVHKGFQQSKNEYQDDSRETW